VSALGLVDTHCHLMDAAFDPDRASVVERAHAAGVSDLVLVGYDIQSSEAAVRLVGRLAGTVASVGIHPNSASDAATSEYARIEELGQRDEVVAIGETGLDYVRDFAAPARQRESFVWHLRLAEQLRKPVIVHNRQADADVADALETSVGRRAVDDCPGVLHCFSADDPAYLQRLLDAGYYVSFAGPLTFKNAAPLRAMAERVPLDRLLVETDCPYLAPVPHRGRRNEPAFLPATAAALAEVHATSLQALAPVLRANALRVFPALAGVGRVVA
jgi:TatD DNase family protein